jgi:hypothetical protein
VKKKTTVPVQGGNATKGSENDRAAREAAVVARLEEIRGEDLVRFDELMRLLAQLQEEARARIK